MALRARKPIRNPPALWVTLLVNITRMVTAPFMTRLCVWRRTSPCACHCSTGRGTLAPSMETDPPRCVTPKCAWIVLLRAFWPILRKTRSISKKIMMRPSQSLWCCRRASRIYSSMALAVLPLVWPPILRRITLAKSLMRPWR